jgi:hypothetical protein
MSLNKKLAAAALLGMASLAQWTPVALAGDPPYRTHVVLYQCPNEPPKTFEYSGGGGNQLATAPSEAKWYWARTRSDRGEGCTIISVDGLPLT